jgi:hypothetical protein
VSQSRLDPIRLRSSDAGRLLEILESDAADALCAAGERAAELLSGPRLWQINSNAASGGVAELLSWFLPLAGEAGIDVRWLALDAPEGFFELTSAGTTPAGCGSWTTTTSPARTCADPGRRLRAASRRPARPRGRG